MAYHAPFDPTAPSGTAIHGAQKLHWPASREDA